jgi:hypothetical protein
MRSCGRRCTSRTSSAWRQQLRDILRRPTFLGVPTTNMKDFLKENVLGYVQ